MEKNRENLSAFISRKDLGLADDHDFGVSLKGYSQYIRVLRQNQRQGTVSCKSRGEVSFSNRKPWKQKGTGRARAGSLRSPLWRKGGIIFGPQARTRKLSIPTSLKRAILESIFFDYLDNNRIVSISLDSLSSPKTGYVYNFLKDIDLHNRKIILFVDKYDYIVQSSFANLPNVKILLFDQPNAYDLSDSDFWVVLDKDINKLKEMILL
jgi:large subunit ribosomal protein L4